MKPSALSDTPPRPIDQRLLINAAWLIKLRWVAVVGQLTTIMFVQRVLRVEIPLAPLLVLIGMTALSNVALSGWFRYARRDATPYSSRVWYGVLGGVMLLDLVVLTSLLYFTGGPTNPFIIFYFVNLALSGILLPSRWAWFLNGVAVGCLAFLSLHHLPVDILIQPDRLPEVPDIWHVSLAGQGLLAAFLTCSSVIVYFTTRLTSELRSRERELRRAEELRARGEKLEALGTLAAGAAHELATPLSTIAVVAKEVERQLKGNESADVAADDIALIRSELDRCRDILNRMSAESGQVMGEPMRVVTAEQLVEHLVGSVKQFSQVRNVFAEGARQCKITLPLSGFTQAMRGIVKNAVDASGPDPVEVRVNADAQSMCLTIRDTGPGMADDVLERAGEPFFTTKPPGKGTGLGLFLARSLVERLGGTLQIQSVVDRGTTVTVRLPLNQDSTT